MVYPYVFSIVPGNAGSGLADSIDIGIEDQVGLRVEGRKLLNDLVHSPDRISLAWFLHSFLQNQKPRTDCSDQG